MIEQLTLSPSDNSLTIKQGKALIMHNIFLSYKRGKHFRGMKLDVNFELLCLKKTHLKLNEETA